MKLEHVTIDDMLRSYLKSNFANCNTLVIWPLSMCDSEAEVETIKQDLFEFGYLPPKSYCHNGFWIIEMPRIRHLKSSTVIVKVHLRCVVIAAMNVSMKICERSKTKYPPKIPPL